MLQKHVCTVHIVLMTCGNVQAAQTSCCRTYLRGSSGAHLYTFMRRADCQSKRYIIQCVQTASRGLKKGRMTSVWRLSKFFLFKANPSKHGVREAATKETINKYSVPTLCTEKNNTHFHVTYKSTTRLWHYKNMLITSRRLLSWHLD